MNLQILQQENGALLMTKIMDNMVVKMKMAQLLSLKQKFIKSNLCDYDAYVLVTRDIAAVGGDQNTPIAFKTVLLLKDV